MYRNDMAECLEKYIDCESNNSAYYDELAKLAPTELSRSILLNFGKDEKSHCQYLQQAYYYILNKIYVLKPAIYPDIPEYKDGLKRRLIEESDEYRKYGTHCIEESNEYLRNLFFLIKSSKAQHMMRIPILFEECI